MNTVVWSSVHDSGFGDQIPQFSVSVAVAGDSFDGELLDVHCMLLEALALVAQAIRDKS